MTDGVRRASPTTNACAGGSDLERRAASSGPRRAALMRMNAAFDIRSILPSISTPTLVLHRTGDLVYDGRHGRYLGEHIPGARSSSFLAPIISRSGRSPTPFSISSKSSSPAPGQSTERFDRVLATVLFTDIVNSTAQAADLGDRAWRGRLDDHDAMVRSELESFPWPRDQHHRRRLHRNLRRPRPRHPLRVCDTRWPRRLGIEVRVGLHTGEVELRDADIGGISVNTAARVQALAAPGEVLVSRTVVDLVAGSGITFGSRGEHHLKGVPGSWTLCAVQDAS